ncbi:peptidoglycan-binding domain-containing protein [Abditibacterium utsteinense]|uniref:peptidoglycan-binding domain-containing protein n=1 Tax=Abditibacterium utsteinense TaxID=1960156 RepID=UPI003CC6BC83
MVGSQSWEALIVPLNRGDRGDAVRAAQTLLSYMKGETNDEVLVDGVFGATTEKDVRLNQKFDRQKIDGSIRVQTWHRWLCAWS